MISASMVKELRETTGAGMLDCKKALEETNGNMEEAITWLREKGISKAAKKASRIAAEGLGLTKVNGNNAVILEVNSETDFVAKNEEFKSLVDKIADILLESNVTNVEDALKLNVDGKTLEELIVEKISTIGDVETDLRSEFKAEGINQTLHRIYLQVDCKVNILTPFDNISEKISNQVLLIEGVIVGNIPDAYYNLEGLNSGQMLEMVE